MHPIWRYIVPLLLCLVATNCRPVTEPATSIGLSPTPTTTEAAASLAPGDYTFTLRHDGRNRSYILHMPSSPLAPTPVVVALHGGGGTGAQFQQENGLDAVADREGFAVIYPEGTGVLPNRLHTWNSGETCCGYSFDRQVDDVGFLRSVLTDVQLRTTIDPARIYMTGHSNGAMMAYRFAVEASDSVTAIATIGGAADLAEPVPSEPVPLLHIHSIDDPRALFEGGEGPPFPGTNRTVYHEPVMPMIQTWAETNGCVLEPRSIDITVGDADNPGQSAERFEWPGCAAGAPVEHLLLAGSGHGWPGVTAPRAVQRHLGPATTLVHASEEVWSFVSQFSD